MKNQCIDLPGISVALYTLVVAHQAKVEGGKYGVREIVKHLYAYFYVGIGILIDVFSSTVLEQEKKPGWFP